MALTDYPLSANRDVGKKTTATVSGLTEGKRYYLAVNAYTTAATSGHANEVSTLTPATTSALMASFTANGSSASSLSVTQGQTANLADNSTVAVTSRSWNLGDGTSATSTTGIKAYSTTGAKTVVLSVTGAGVTKTASKTDNLMAPGSTSATAGTSGSSSGTSGNGASAAYPLQFGEIQIDHTWKRVSFQTPFGDPIVIAGPLSRNGGDPAVVRVQGVDAKGFWIRVQEWEYLDGTHQSATVSYLVMERGRYQLPNWAWREAGRLVTSATGSVVAQSFSKPFSETPVVLATVTSTNEADAVTSRIRNVNHIGFEIGMQEQEANVQKHLSESIHYIGWEPSFGFINGVQYEVGIVAKRLTDKPQTLLYGTPHLQPPRFFADMQTANELDTANLRWQNRNEASPEVRVSEEASKDSETTHGAESVGFLPGAIGSATDGESALPEHRC